MVSKRVTVLSHDTNAQRNTLKKTIIKRTLQYVKFFPREKNLTKDFYEIIEHDQSVIDLYNGDCKGTFLEPVLSKINIFESKPDSIIAKEYDVTYTILNPMLNNVKQTLSKTYYINSDITKILKVETKEL